MYEAHFGLRRRPFPTTPDPACYYPASGHEQALEALLLGLADGEGVLLLTAGPGVGKTLIGHCLVERLGPEVASAFLTHATMKDRAGLLQALLFDLGLPYQGLAEQDMRLALINHLLAGFAAGRKTVLVIDEAHHLGPDLLEELRMLGNLEGRDGKAVQIVLLAQPALLVTLNRPELASLRQRLAVRPTLEPLGVEEAADYVLHHLRTAGSSGQPLFDGEALELLARATGGVPRLLNQAAHQALRLAAGTEPGEVDAEAVVEALAQLGLSAPADEETPQAAPPSPAPYRLFAPAHSA